MDIYEGNEPYIFISYSHRDSGLVSPIVNELQSRGFRVWYDPGIEPGAEWPEYIAEHIDRCEVFLAFMSGNANSSANCRQEIHRAIHKGKGILVAYLEETRLTPGMEMRLEPLQAIKRWKFDSDKAFASSLAGARLIQTCRYTESAGKSNFVNVGRNDHCPCGSGKKYKHCHGAQARGSIEKTVSADGKFFSKQITLPRGHEAIFKLTIKNTGTTKLSNATVVDRFPSGMALVPGSVKLTVNDSGVWGKLPDAIGKAGYNLCAFDAGNIAHITYRALINGPAESGTSYLINRASLAYDGGTIQDSATVVIEPQGSFLIDPAVLSTLVDNLITAKYKALPPFGTKELTDLKEQSVRELDEKIGLAVLSKFTPEQNRRLDELLDRDASEREFSDLIDSAGIDIDKITRTTIEDYVREFMSR